MTNHALELWKKNYRGEGDTQELETFLKKLDFGSKKGAQYLPWAVVERIFRWQDGKITLLRDEDGNTVEREQIQRAITVMDETDRNLDFTEYVNTYYVNVKAEWMGEVHVERYPLQDSSGRALTSFTQNDVNKSFQRAKVKAIGAVSGIGYKLYEDGDLQFDDTSGSGDEKTTKKEISTKTKTAIKKDFKKKKINKPDKPDKPDKDEESVEVNDSTGEVTEKTETKKTDKLAKHHKKKEKDEGKIDPENPLSRKEMESAIKRAYISGGDKMTNAISEFLKQHDTIKVADLDEKQIVELYAISQV